MYTSLTVKSSRARDEREKQMFFQQRADSNDYLLFHNQHGCGAGRSSRKSERGSNRQPSPTTYAGRKNGFDSGRRRRSGSVPGPSRVFARGSATSHSFSAVR